MLYQNYKYNINFERSRRLKLRYIAIPIIVIALFISFANWGDSADTKNVIAEKTSSELNNLNKSKENIADNYNNISPAAGNPDDYQEDIDITKVKHLLDKNIITPIVKALDRNIRLSEEETNLPIAENILKPAKKPFTKIKEENTELSNYGNVTSKTITVSKGKTFSTILEMAGIGASKIYNISTSISSLYDPKDMQIGQEITVYKKDGEFVGLDIKKDLLNTVAVRAMKDGRLGVAEKTTPTNNIRFVKEGVITSSLYKAALDAGVPENLIVEMIHIYSWAVDFQRDIQANDKFEIMYDMTITEDGKEVPNAAKIVYVSLDLKNAGRISLYRYEDKNGDVGYFEEDGRSVRKALMKTPINGARISSGFGRRKHPVLGYTKMHKGIDFAAPRGTPIYAAGDGRISYIGRRGGYGNYIKIRHHAGLETAYAHMKKFRKGLHKGSRVKQGQIIGYVGTTGRSTGPHLHYEVLSAGRQVNPRKLKMQKGKKLAGADLELFQGIVAQTKQQFVELQQQLVSSN